MQRRSCRMVMARAVIASVIMLAAGRRFHAQSPPIPPSAADAALAAKSGVPALPEATRKAAGRTRWSGSDLQRGGRWRLRPSNARRNLALEASAKAPPNGALSASELKATPAAADKAREAVGFKVVNDPKSGARIGAPTKLIGERARSNLNFASSTDADPRSALRAALRPAPGRRIAYKAIKPDAFRCLGAGGDDRTSTPGSTRTPAASPPIRGFTFAYPPRRPLGSTGSRSRSPIRSSRFRRPPLAAASAAVGAGVTPGSGCIAAGACSCAGGNRAGRRPWQGVDRA